MPMYTLIIADDHNIVRTGIRSVFEARGDVEIVAETGDGMETVGAMKRLQPAAILLDVSMPLISGVEICVEAKRWSPDTHLIVFTGINAGSVLQELLDEGVKGIVLKSEDVQLLTAAFDAVMAGQIYLSVAAREILESTQQIFDLTSRERQILKFIISGNTTAEIAKLLSVSHKTVENHRTNLMRKLKVHSVTELMALAYREKLVTFSVDSQ